MKYRENKKLNMLIGAVLLILIAAYGFYVNRSIVIKGLYMDDLYMWSCYGEQNLIEFAFPIGTSTRFRPVYWLATYLQMMIVGTHISRFVAFNIIVNILVAYELFFMAKKLSKSSLVSTAVSICYLSSRFAYYQIGQALGLMETMALGFAIGILYLLYRVMTDPESRTIDRDYYGALVLYFLLAFTHERYISLIPLFYLVLLTRIVFTGRSVIRKDLKKWILPAAVLVLIVLIRAFAIGKAIPAGTGGTQVTETFSAREAISYAISQVFYVFGINVGPEHLNGLPWEQTPVEIKRLIKLSVLAIAGLTAVYGINVISLLFGKKDEAASADFNSDSFAANVAVCLLFGGFIALCIACSSVTIRVEMRWIYVSYAAALLFASYMIGSVMRNRRRIGMMLIAVFLIYSALSVKTNLFGRGYFYKLYFWPNQLRMNSLAEQTVEKYGTDGVFGKDIYILENTYEMTDFYGRTFFKTFDPEKKAEGTTVIFAESRDDIRMQDVKDGKALVLIEVPEDNAYLDITQDLMKE